MNRNWMALAAGLLFTLTACNTDEVPQGTVAYNPQQRTGEVAPEELFSSMEVITLQCPDEVIVDTGNDLLFDASLDIPAQELRKPALEALQAILLLLIFPPQPAVQGRGAFGSTGPISVFSCCSVS